MTRDDLLALLDSVREGDTEVRDAFERLVAAPMEEDLGFAVLDHHRALRKGMPEVIYGGSKTIAHVVTLLERIHRQGHNALATRIEAEKGEAIVRAISEATYHPVARAVTLEAHPFKQVGQGPIAVIAAGTSDLPVSEEAALTAELFGNQVVRITDVGVAGLHRLLHRYQAIRSARVLVVVAGMEGALPSVVAGLVDRPVIAVPTSVGYGASFGGVAALLGMLNSCASGVTVVNIDNGFGAGFAAALMNRE